MQQHFELVAAVPAHTSGARGRLVKALLAASMAVVVVVIPISFADQKARQTERVLQTEHPKLFVDTTAKRVITVHFLPSRP